jgi:hypothetical protein
MKKIILTLLFVFIVSCTPKLSQNFIDSNKKIYIEQWGSWFPDGYSSLVSLNYPGVLALGDDEFIFDADGPASRPWMNRLSPFTIDIGNIERIDISDYKIFNKQVLYITTTDGYTYEFLISNGDAFFTVMEKWLTMSDTIYQENKLR